MKLKLIDGGKGTRPARAAQAESEIRALRRMLDYAERSAADAGLEMTAHLIGVAALSIRRAPAAPEPAIKEPAPGHGAAE